MKKIFLSITALAIAVFLSLGCVTKQVWTDKVRGEPYKERIISFYNNTKDEKIIFIGQKYHYIFDEGSKEFSVFLEAKKRLNLKESSLKIHAYTGREDRQKIYATLNFQFRKNDLTQEQKSWIEKQNRLIRMPKPIKYTAPVAPPYQPNQSEVDRYIINYQLSGKRYQSNSQVNNRVVQLKNPIDIEVVEYKVKDKKSTLYKVAMTPLSATADAGLIIIGAGVAIIYAPFAFGHWAYNSIKK